MTIQEKDLRRIAQFFYKHRNYSAWWISPLLLQHPEAQPFQLSPAEAEQVFQAFEEMGFLKKDGSNTHTVGTQQFQKYLFNLAGLKALREYANIPFWYKWFSDTWIDRIERIKTLLVVCFVLVVTALIQALIESFGADFYSFIKGIFKK